MPETSDLHTPICLDCGSTTLTADGRIVHGALLLGPQPEHRVVTRAVYDLVHVQAMRHT